MIYLHRFDTVSDFAEGYCRDGEVAYFTCASGTFVCDRFDPEIGYIWTNGTTELRTDSRDAMTKGERAARTFQGDRIPIDSVTYGGGYKEPWVSCTDENGKVNYNKPGFTIRVGISGTSIFNDSFTRKVPAGCHITDADLGDITAWYEWAATVQQISEGGYDEAVGGYGAVITDFPSSLYYNDEEVFDVSAPLFHEYGNDAATISSTVGTQIAGATVSEAAAGQTFTILLRPITIA